MAVVCLSTTSIGGRDHFKVNERRSKNRQSRPDRNGRPGRVSRRKTLWCLGLITTLWIHCERSPPLDASTTRRSLLLSRDGVGKI